MRAKTTSLRWKLFAPLVAVLVPLLVTTWVTLRVVDARLTDRLERDLRNTAELEVSRLTLALDRAHDQARSLAAGDEVVAAIDPSGAIDRPVGRSLDLVAAAVLAGSQDVDRTVIDIAIFDTDGRIAGGTAPDCQLCPTAILEEVATTGLVQIAPAYRDETGFDRLPVVAPIVGRGSSVVGLLMVDFDLGPIVDPVVAHEQLGETSEAHLAQRDPSGDAHFITPLRFAQDAAFSRVAAAAQDSPIVRSLEASELEVIHAADYRGEQSILAIQRVPGTSWGLVVKVDSSEILAPVADLRQLIVALVGGASVLMIAAWVAVINPLVARLRDTAAAARRVATGELDSRISDPRRDEIGIMAASIDQLALDLADDKAERSRAERKLRYRASYDELTGIANRRTAIGWLKEALSEPDSSDDVVCLLFVDVDNFKAVNDTYGHDVGDQVLTSIAGRLRGIAPSDALVARWGGDEFLVGVAGPGPQDVEALAESARSAFDEPIIAGDRLLEVGVSVGTSICADGASAEGCIQRADASMYERKRQQRRRFGDSSPEACARVRSAIDTGRVVVVYQPIVELDSQKRTLCSIEALARLDESAAAGLIPADDFIHQIESTDLAVEVDRLVFKAALEQFARWQQAGDVAAEVTMSVNLSPASLHDRTLPNFLANQLGDHGIDSSSVVVELSERCLYVDPAIIGGLQDIGLLLGIDDFGVLGSNLDRVVDLRPAVVKVDRRWLGCDETEEENVEAPIIEAVTALCRAKHIEVVAEGVETIAQESTLRRLGIQRAQGYLYGRPDAAVPVAATISP